jgi:hypothetical protein
MRRDCTITDPVAALAALDPDTIAKRLEELAAERQALMVLLRSARARDQAKRRQHASRGKGAAHG